MTCAAVGQEMFPEATGDISSEKFDPAYFLLEHHHNTAFDDIKAGLEHLRKAIPDLLCISDEKFRIINWTACVTDS